MHVIPCVVPLPCMFLTAPLSLLSWILKYQRVRKGWAGGGWRPTTPKILSPRIVFSYSQGGHRIYGMGGISLRRPPLSANPLSKPLTIMWTSCYKTNIILHYQGRPRHSHNHNASDAASKHHLVAHQMKNHCVFLCVPLCKRGI